MPKPSDIPVWSTDPNTTADPGVTRRATGFVQGKLLPAKWLNWVLNRQGAWFQYLRDLHLEPEFLSKTYPWTGAHGFASSVGLFGQTVLGPAVELLYGNGAGIPTPKYRTVMVPTTWMWSEHVSSDHTNLAWKRNRTRQTSYGGTDTLVSTGGFQCMQTNRRLVAEFPVPTGTRVTACALGMQLPNSGYSVRLEVGTRNNGFLSAGVVPIADNTAWESFFAKDFALPQATGLLEYDFAVDHGPNIYYEPDRTYSTVQVMVSILSGTGNFDAPTTLTAPYDLNWMAVRLYDPGPRNF